MSKKQQIKVVRKDVTFEPVKGGIGAGGQHSQKNATGVRAYHRPTGIVVVIRGRSLATSKRRAVEAIAQRLNQEAEAAVATARKAKWKQAIGERRIIRSYVYSRNEVKDHRTGRKADLRKVMEEGRIDLLQRPEDFE
jgi:protein subunit release factor A